MANNPTGLQANNTLIEILLRLERWPHARVVVTCRRGVVDNVARRFGVGGRAGSVRTRYMLPFTAGQQRTYLQRCGFNAFEMADEAQLESALESLADFSESYQAAIDQPQPLFRRRA